MKTIIYTCVTNNTFLELQVKSIKKYFKTNYEFIVLMTCDKNQNHSKK